MSPPEKVKPVKPFNLEEEMIWGIEKLKLQNLKQLDSDTIRDLIKSYCPTKNDKFNMSEVGKEAGLDPFLVEVIDFLANRMYFYITLVCIYDKAVTELKNKKTKEKEPRNSGEGEDIIFN